MTGASTWPADRAAAGRLTELIMGSIPDDVRKSMDARAARMAQAISEHAEQFVSAETNEWAARMIEQIRTSALSDLKLNPALTTNLAQFARTQPFRPEGVLAVATDDSWTHLADALSDEPEFAEFVDAAVAPLEERFRDDPELSHLVTSPSHFKAVAAAVFIAYLSAVLYIVSPETAAALDEAGGWLERGLLAYYLLTGLPRDTD